MEFSEELENALTELDSSIILIGETTDFTNGADIKNSLDLIVAKASDVLIAAKWV